MRYDERSRAHRELWIQCDRIASHVNANFVRRHLNEFLNLLFQKNLLRDGYGSDAAAGAIVYWISKGLGHPRSLDKIARLSLVHKWQIERILELWDPVLQRHFARLNHVALRNDA